MRQNRESRVVRAALRFQFHTRDICLSIPEMSAGDPATAGEAAAAVRADLLAQPRFAWGRLRWALRNVLDVCAPGDRVLDVGCGKGWLVEAFSKAGLVASGIDVDPKAVEDSRRLCPAADIRSYEGVALPYPDGHFRAVTFIEALEHVGDEAAVLREIRRVLIPGGTLVLTTPHAGDWAWMDPDNFKFRAPWAHKSLYALLGRSEEYQRRFGDSRRAVVGNFTKRTDGSAHWHRHYTRGQVETLAAGFEIGQCRREGGFLFATALVVNYLADKVIGTWPAPVTAIMRWDARKDRGARGWALQMTLRKVD